MFFYLLFSYRNAALLAGNVCYCLLIASFVTVNFDGQVYHITMHTVPDKNKSRYSRRNPKMKIRAHELPSITQVVEWLENLRQSKLTKMY